MSMPKQKPGKSRQDYQTPPDFLAAVILAYGPFTWDLAASAKNTAAHNYYTKEQNSLAQDWTKLHGNLWLNPPFGMCDLFAEKCAISTGPGRRIIMLTPASVSCNWFADFVWGKALIMPVRPRLTFVGETTPYPKDLMLTIWEPLPITGLSLWRYR